VTEEAVAAFTRLELDARMASRQNLSAYFTSGYHDARVRDLRRALRRPVSAMPGGSWVARFLLGDVKRASTGAACWRLTVQVIRQ
jgi:hypothetical protein